MQGEHGLFSLFQVEAQESQLKSELADLQAERATISNKTRRLSTDHLDADLLDEQARQGAGPRARGRNHHPLTGRQRPVRLGLFPALHSPV